MTTSEIESMLIEVHLREQEIAEATKKRDESIRFYQSRIDMVKKNFAVDTRLANFELDHYKAQLEHYLRENPPARGKSIKFGGGTIGFTKQEPHFYFAGKEIKNDDAEFVNYLRADYGQYIKRKEYVDWAGFKAKLSVTEDGKVSYEPTGELVPQLKAQVLTDKFYVKTV